MSKKFSFNKYYNMYIQDRSFENYFNKIKETTNVDNINSDFYKNYFKQNNINVKTATNIAKEQLNTGNIPEFLNNGKFEQYVKNSYDSIAPLSSEVIDDIVDGFSNRPNKSQYTMVEGVKYFQKIQDEVIPEKQKNDVLKNMTNFFSVVTNKKHSGKELNDEVIQQDIKYQKSKAQRGYSISKVKDLKERLNNAKTVIDFDLETTGGKDKLKRNQFINVTEFSGLKFSKDKNGAFSNVEKISNILPINEKDYNKYMDIINDAKVYGSSTDQHKVVLDYFSKFANEKNKIINDAGNYSVNIVEDVENSSVETALKGLGRFNKEIKHTDIVDGVSKQERDFVKMLHTIQNGFDSPDSLVAGHNISEFDLNKLNYVLANNEKISTSFGSSKLNINTNNILDTYKVAETYNHYNNINTLFDNDTIKYAKNTNSTLLKNEVWLQHPKNNISTSIYKNIAGESTAHTATTDTLGNSIAILGQNGDLKDSLVGKMLNDLDKETVENEINLKDYKDYMFFNNKSSYKDDFFGKNQLNFAFDDDSGMIMTGNGKAFTLGKNNSIDFVEDYGMATLNKDVPYTIDNIGKYNPTKKELEEIKKLNPEYAVDELYYAVYNPQTINKEDIRRSRKYVTVGKSKEEIFDNLGIPIAKKTNDGFKPISKEYDEKLKKEFSKRFNILENEITYKDDSYSNLTFFEQLKLIGGESSLEDSARRYNDDISYTRAKKISSLKNEINTLKETIPEFKDSSQEDVINKAYERLNNKVKTKGLYEASREISEKTSKNQVIGTTNPLDSIIGVLGYNTPNREMLHLPQQSTIKNIQNSLEYTDSISPIMNGIVEHIDSSANFKDLNNGQKDFVYNKIMEGLQSKAYYNTKDKNAFGHNLPLDMNKEDLMYYELNLDKKLFNIKNNNKIISKQNINDDTSDILRINLNKKEGDISNKLLSSLGVKTKHLTKQQEKDTKESLMSSFITQLKSDEKLSDTFKDFDIENGISFNNNGEIIKDADTKVISREIQNRLKGIVDETPTAGKIVPRTYKSGYIPNEVLKDFYKNPETLKDSILEMSSAIPSQEKFSEDSIRNNVRKFLKTNHKELSIYEDPEKIQEMLGITKAQAMQQHKLYKNAMGEMEDVYSDLITNASKMNLSPIFTDDNIIIKNNYKDAEAVVLDRLPRIKMGSRGELTVGVKNNEYRLNHELINDHGTLRQGTNIKSSFKDMDASFKYMAQRGVENDNELDAVTSMVSNLTEKIAESPAITRHDSIEAQSNFVVKTNAIGNFLKKPDVLKSLNVKDEKERDALLDFIKSNSSKEVGENNFITDFLGGNLEAYGHFGEQIKDILHDKGYVDDEAYELLKDLATLKVKDTSTPKAEQNIGSFHLDPFSMFTNEQRPNQFQEHDITFNKEEAIKRGQKLSGKNNALFSLNPSIGNEKVMAQKFNINNKYASSAEINSFHTSEDSLKTLINKKKVSIGKLSDKEERIFKILDSISLHDGEGIVNPIFSQAVSPEDVPQYVSASKDVLLELNNDKKFNEEVQNLAGKLLPKYEIKNGKLQVTLQKEGKYVKRFDEIIKTVGYENTPIKWENKSDIASVAFGFYKDNTKLSEKEINNIINENNITSVEELYNFFNKHGDMRFTASNANLAGYKKLILNNAEKMEASSALATPGSLNKDIKNALAGLSDDTKIAGDITIKDFKERVWKQDDLENLSKKIYKLKGFDKTNFKSANNFSESLLKEELEPSKFLFEDIIQEQLKKSGIAGVTPALIESSSTVKHKSVNLRMYSDISLIKEAADKKGVSINELLESSAAFDGKEYKFTDILQGKINNKTQSLFYVNPKYKNTLMVSQEYEGGHYDDKVNPDAIKAFMNKYGLKTDDKYGLIVQDEIENGEKLNVGQMFKVLASHHSEESKLTSSNHGTHDIERGMSIGDREIFMMNRTKTDTVFRYLEDNKNKGFMNKKDFNRLTSHLVDESGKIKQEDINRPLLKYFTDDFVQQGYLSSEDILKEKNGEKIRLSNYLNKEEYKHLSNIGESFKNKEGVAGKNISLEAAQNIYDIQNTFKSVDYNNGYIDSKQAKKIFGDSVGVSKLSFGTNKNLKVAKKSEHNIYKPQIIDFYEGLDGLGLDNFEVPTGINRKMAIPGFHPKEFGESAIPTKYEKQLKKIHGMHQGLLDTNKGIGINASKGENKQTVLNSRLKSYQREVDKIKDLIAEDGLAKEGIYGQHSKTRLTQSATGKISGKVVRLPGDLNGIQGADGLSKYISQIDDKLDIDSVNSFLSGVKFDNKSIIDNMKSGNNVDFRFMSKDAFKNMGFYNEENLIRQSGKTKKDFNVMSKKQQNKLLKKAESDIDNSLKTGGVTGLGGRYPSIYDESFKPIQFYMNDDLHGHRILTSAEGTAAMKGDYDGDLTPSTIVKFGKNKNINSMEMEKVINEKDESTKKALMNRLQIGEADINAHKDLRLAMEYQGRGMNALERTRSSKMRVKAHNEAITDINDYLEPSRYFYNFNGKSSKDLRNRQDLAMEQYVKIKNKATDTLTDQGIKNTHDDYENLLVKQMDNIANKLSPDHKESMVYGLLNAKDDMAVAAAHKKLSIAAVNPSLFSLRRLSEVNFQTKPDMKNRDYYQELVQGMATAIEQTNISTKNSKDLGQEVLGKTNRYLKAHKKALYKNDVSDLKTFLTDEVGEKTIEEFVIEPMQHKIAKSEIKHIDTKGLIEDYTKYIGNLKNELGGIENIAGMEGAFKLGHSVKVKKHPSAATKYMIGNSTASDYLGKKIIESDSYFAGPKQLEGLLKEKSEEKIKKLSLIDGREAMEKSRVGVKEEVKKAFSGVSETIAKTTKGLSSKGLAIGALGLAGGVLAAGFVGGNPTRPAENHASEQSKDNNSSDFYDTPQLADTNQYQNKRQQQGYVVNINAQTKKGQHNTVQTIQNAVSQNVPTDVNLAININNKNGNINDRDIENVLSGML